MAKRKVQVLRQRLAISGVSEKFLRRERIKGIAKKAKLGKGKRDNVVL